MYLATALGSASIAFAPLASVRADETVLVPRGIAVPIVVTKEIRIGGLGEQGQTPTEKFEVAQDVIDRGHFIAKKGDVVEMHYTANRNATVGLLGGKVSQEVALDADDLINFCGDTVHLEYERTAMGNARAGAFSFGMHAKDAVFDKGMILVAKTDRVEKHICTERTSEAPLPI
ncbi:MAG: hypothetical protein IAI48_09965, partial [Candidatus Eremiobacteraeota bacterium]|nr:hypothetical protein [Candidatus Eremiobacteraeota bacterium]